MVPKQALGGFSAGGTDLLPSPGSQVNFRKEWLCFAAVWELDWGWRRFVTLCLCTLVDCFTFFLVVNFLPRLVFGWEQEGPPRVGLGK